jgi:hypothetical protein
MGGMKFETQVPRRGCPAAFQNYAGRVRIQSGCIHFLPQLFCGTARASLQDGLQTVRILFELLGFLLEPDSAAWSGESVYNSLRSKWIVPGGVRLSQR